MAIGSLCIDKVSVTLIRASDGRTFPVASKRQYSEAVSHSDSKTHLVDNGDTFLLRLTVRPDFEWYDSNVLSTKVKFDHSSVRRGQVFEYPLIVKPAVDGTEVTVDFDRCLTCENSPPRWQGSITRFSHVKVHCSKLTQCTLVDASP